MIREFCDLCDKEFKTEYRNNVDKVATIKIQIDQMNYGQTYGNAGSGKHIELNVCYHCRNIFGGNWHAEEVMETLLQPIKKAATNK